MNILVIDDSSFARRSTVKFLKMQFPDANFFTAEDGQEGYEIFVRERPELTTVDLLMPVLDGAGFIKKARTAIEEAFIIVLSADVQELVKEEIHGMGVHLFLNKPISPDKAAQIAEETRKFYAES